MPIEPTWPEENQLADVSTFLLDGTGYPSPGYLWVSDDEDTRERYLVNLARSILNGDALPDFAGRRLFVCECPAVVGLARREGVSALISTIDEVEDSGVAFGLNRIEMMLDSAAGKGFLDGVLDAMRDSRIGCFLALTGSTGLERLKAEAPRLLGFCTVQMLDETPPWSVDFRSLAVQGNPDDPSERGWVIAVRCRFTAPAPALAALAAGSDFLGAGGIGAFDDERVDNLAVVHNDSVAALIVSLWPDSAGPEEPDLADEIALDAAGTAVWRPLRPDEELAVVRKVHFQ